MSLFVGFPLLPHHESHVESERALPFLKKGDPTVLELLSWKNQTYVGRFIDGPLSSTAFDSLKANLYSLTSKFLPDMEPNQVVAIAHEPPSR